MSTNHGTCRRIKLGTVGRDTQQRLEEVKAKWMEFSPHPPSLVLRRNEAGAASPREVAGEILEFLDQLPRERRNAAALDALRHLDEATSHYLLRLIKRLGNLESTFRKCATSQVLRTTVKS